MSLKVGAHVSIAGGVDNAVENQLEVGGNCGQIFTHSPQVWQDPDIGDEEAERFREPQFVPLLHLLERLLGYELPLDQGPMEPE